MDTNRPLRHTEPVDGAGAAAEWDTQGQDSRCSRLCLSYTTRPIRTGCTKPRRNGRLIVGFLGRFTGAKGIDLLVRAVQRLPRDLPLELRIHGIVQSAEEESCRQEVLELAGDDPRIRILAPLCGEQVLPTLAQWDVLAVPSRVQDMRPQVILEAFAVGVPVIGSKCGGIPDLVQHECNGLLVAPGSVTDLVDALWRLSSEPGLLEGLRQGVPDVPGIGVLADFMQQVYQSVAVPSQAKIGAA